MHSAVTPNLLKPHAPRSQDPSNPDCCTREGR